MCGSPKTGIAFDSTYAVRVMVLEDTAIYADSKLFSITAATGIDEENTHPVTYSSEPELSESVQPNNSYQLSGASGQ